MTRSRATQGNNAQFTYDFGIAIAQSTVNKITRLTGATLSLASAFYALRTTAEKYVDTLRENTLRFGGVLSTMKAMEQAQNRLIKGQSYFSVDDQLRGMNQLMAAGVKVGKNLDWINKAAHATGKSFAEFSGMISSAINGNLQSLVDAGLMTQRATKMFAKFQGNTIMMQGAIMSFLKSHKGLMNAIKNDFVTIQDGTNRLKEVFRSFLMSVVGKPNDPGSLYGAVSGILQQFADKFGKDGVLTKNMIALRNYGKGVGIVMTWVVRQVGHVMMWLARQAKKVTTTLLGTSEDFVNRMRSLVVWLEFWKLKIRDFFEEYKDLIKGVLKMLIIYKALKSVFFIGGAALKSIIAYKNAISGTIKLQQRYMASMGPYVSKTAKFFQSLAVWMPLMFRKTWVSMGKFFANFKLNMLMIGKSIVSALKAPFKWIASSIKFLGGMIRNLPVLVLSVGRALKSLWAALNATNPVGWIILAITVATILYTKWKSFREFINGMFGMIIEAIKFVWNLAAFFLTGIIGSLKQIWKLIKWIFKQLWSLIKWVWNKITSFFGWLWDGFVRVFGGAIDIIKNMWKAFMNTSVGRWVDKWIITPLSKVIDGIKWVFSNIPKLPASIANLFGRGSGGLQTATDYLADQLGVGAVPTFSGKTNYIGDSTNYLNPKNWNIGNPFSGASDLVPQVDLSHLPSEKDNPLLSNNTPQHDVSSPTSMTFNNGAIQIVVQKGENIDENKLARKVKQVILDMKREGELRGGAA